MKNTALVGMLALSLICFSGGPAHAFYSPAQGRWLSRDPLGEVGGANLNGFVRNAAVGKVDRLGLFVSPNPGDSWPIFETFCPMCAGKRYFILKQCCCCDGQTGGGGSGANCKILDKSPVETGITMNNFAPSNPTDTSFGHQWLSWGGGGSGYNAMNSGLCLGNGDPFLSNPTPVPGTHTPTPIKLSPCKYDIKKFADCVKQQGASCTPPIGGGDCGTYVNNVVGDCKAKSRGCGVP